MSRFFAVVEILFLIKDACAFNDDFISVNLSNYKLLTEDKPVWDNPHQVLLPTFLDELEFECNSTFPTKWVLSINPLEDPELKDVPKILKSRSREGPKGHFTFTSKILLKFKDPRGIQQFTCQAARHIHGMSKSVAVETTISSPHRLTTKFIPDKFIQKTAKIYGESQDCGLILEVDFPRRSFACQRNGVRDLVPRLVLCRNADECDSIANTEKPSCENSIKLHCSHKDCRQFQPKKKPGIIVCGDGVNSLASKYVVLDSLAANSSTLVKYDGASSSSSDFIHLMQSTYTVYDGQEVAFICKASKYVYSRGFQWVLSTDSAVSHVVDEGNQILTISHGTYIINKSITFNTSIYGNVTKLSCLGPIWNSRESARADAQIVLRVPLKPTIQEKNTTITVFSGDITLDCTYKGEPKPTVTWFVWNKIVLQDEEFFRINHRNKSSHFTIFGIETLAQQNRRLLRITCHVQNFLGTDERLFTVTSTNSDTPNRLLLIIVICLVVIIIVLVTAGWFYLKWVRSKNLEYVKKDIQLFLEGDPNIPEHNENDPSSAALSKPYNSELEVSLANMEIDRKNPLGSGAYGMVFRGVVMGGRCVGKTSVAIKTLRSNVEPSYFKSLLAELKVILYVGQHENIVNLLACCTEKLYEMELYVVLELCQNGELHKYLTTHREEFVADTAIIGNSNIFSIHRLFVWSYEIANGMDFLVSKKVIHMDLATRNVLLNETLSAKICDFGLSKITLYKYTQYVKKQQAPLPYRWMAIESLRDMQFSSESDVWGYGVTLWELYSLGEVPYPGLSWTTEFLQSLIDGFRMKKPTHCPEEIYLVMMNCWKARPQDRPSFKDLKTLFKKYI